MVPPSEPEILRGPPGEEKASLLECMPSSAAVVQEVDLATASPASVEEDLPEGVSSSGAFLTFEVQAKVDEEHVIKCVNWHLIPMFFFLALLCSVDRANLSFAAQQMDHDLHFSEAVYGMGAGIFFIGYAFFAIPSTFVCAWMGTPSFLGGILVVWGLTASLFSVMTNAWQFYVLRFLLGLAESGAYPAMWYHLALFYTERELGLAYTIVATASSLSGVVGGPMAAGLLQMDGVLGLHGWQWLFLLEGVPAVLLGIVIRLHLARTPAAATFLKPEERAWLASRKQSAEVKSAKSEADEEGLLPEASSRGEYLASFLCMVREWRIWWVGAIWSLASVGMDGLIFWLPMLINAIFFGDTDDEDEDREELNHRAVQSALLSAVPFTVAAASMVFVAWLAKRTGERRGHIAVPLLVAVASLITLPLVEGHVTWLAFAMLTSAAGGIWAVHGPLLSWPAALLDGTAAASGFALVKMLGSLAAFLGNLMIGELHEVTGSYNIPMWLLAGLMSTAALLALCLSEPGGPGSQVASMPMLTRLQNRLGMKRSRSDPISFSSDRSTTPGIAAGFRSHNGYELFDAGKGPKGPDTSSEEVVVPPQTSLQRLYADLGHGNDPVELQLSLHPGVHRLYPQLGARSESVEVAAVPLPRDSPRLYPSLHTIRDTH